ncbi:MAG: C-GCAxxG-C-C family (seleno)protein [Fusobacteriaceae bacterium]
MSKKTNYVKGGFNCAECLIDAHNKHNNANIPVSLGSGMGSGLTVASLCGAVNAAAIIIGAVKGRNNSEDPNEARALVNQLMTSVRAKYGSEICLDLKKTGIDCADIVEFVYQELDRILGVK